MLMIKGKTITAAGLIAEVIHETKTRVKVKVVALFFPKHFTKSGTYQVGKDSREWLFERNIGRELEFWKMGTRADFEVGGDRKIIDWEA